MPLLISETFTNETENYQLGETEPYEPYTDDVKRLFRSLQRDYGRCTGGVYIDTTSGKSKRIGWHFEKRMEYEDWPRFKRGERYYMRGVWVTLHDAPPTKSTEYHYHELSA